MKTRPFVICTVALGLLSSGVLAQEDYVRRDQLATLQQELGNVSSRVQDSLVKTRNSMSALEGYGGDELTNQAYEMLDAIEVETRVVLDQVKLNSNFMDALDDARAQVVTIMRKQEREPSSPARDDRIARLTVALESLDEQYDKISTAEATMTRLLADHAEMRREIQLNGEVRAVETFVADLSGLTEGLDRMVAVLDEVSKTVIDVPTGPNIGQD